MKRFVLCLFAAFCATGISARAQTSPNPAPQATPPVAEDGEVVKITTNLIRIDVTVTDSKGRQVTDLKPEDFEIYENDQKQDITNFSYVEVKSEKSAEEEKTAAKPDKNAVAAPPRTTIRPEKIRRTIALVVDDLGLSFESMHFVREALKKFVSEQMQPDDLAAIIRTGGGIGALQSFTSNKQQLFAAIDKVRWNSLGRSGIGAFSVIEPSTADRAENSGGLNEEQIQAMRDFENGTQDFREDVFAVGTLGALNYVVRGMSELPGRKAVTLFSDGFPLNRRNDPTHSRRIPEAIQILTDLANRSAVVINTIDARGLQTLGFTAADSVSEMTSAQRDRAADERRTELFENQNGLVYLAQQTGGRSFIDSNDISGNVQKILNDQNGYYLLGYTPDDETFDPQTRRFNRLNVRVKREGLTVKFRSGFFGVTNDDEKRRPANQTPQQQIFNALASPFGATELPLRLNALFGHDARSGSYISSVLYIDPNSLTFTDAADNKKKAVFDILAVTFGDNGVALDSVSKTYTLQISPANLKQLKNEGLIYRLVVPTKKAGGYQLRIAMRDSSGKVGSVNQFVQIPDLKKNRLTLSGITLQTLTDEQWRKYQKGESIGDRAELAQTSETATALRRFRRGSILVYGLTAFNFSGASPQLTIQTRLFKDDKLISDGKPAAVASDAKNEMKAISTTGALRFGAAMEEGSYILQIIVRDNSAKEKFAVATQFVEFDLVR